MKINKLYYQLAKNIEGSDKEDKGKYLNILKREILGDIKSGKITGKIKDPETMEKFLLSIGMPGGDINHVIHAMGEEKSHSNIYHENDIILITGQSGIGKTHQAKQIHQFANPKGKFIIINGATLRPEFHGAELFGVEKGAYTGANEDKMGAFVAAEDGTLFIDELQSLSPEVQGMLNVALDEKAVTKVGPSNIKVPYQCKLIFASNENLEELVEDGKFRGDLYSRLTGPESHHIDIGNLNPEKILEITNQEADNLDIDISQETLALLQKIDYDYGVRELKTLIRRAQKAAREEGVNQIEPRHLESEKINLEKRAGEAREKFDFDQETMRYLANAKAVKNPDLFPLERIQKDRIAQVYEQLGGDEDSMLEWLQRGNLGLVTKYLTDARDLSAKSITNAFKEVMGDFAVVENDIIKGMRKVSNILESTEDDPFSSILPEKRESEEIDQRVLEVMDHTVLMANEDILGIVNNL